MMRRVHVLEDYTVRTDGFVRYRIACWPYAEMAQSARGSDLDLAQTRPRAAVLDGTASADITCKSCRRLYDLPIAAVPKAEPRAPARPTGRFVDVMSTPIDGPIDGLPALATRTYNALVRKLSLPWARDYSAPIPVGDIYTRFRFSSLPELPQMSRQAASALDERFGTLGIPLVRDLPCWEYLEGSSSSLPHEVLVVELAQRWSRGSASVLADWCEERSLHGTARHLRFGPTAECRAALISLSRSLDLRVDRTPDVPDPTGRLLDWLAAGFALEKEGSE